jgi:hypothetical protein
MSPIWDEYDFSTSTFWTQVHGLPSAWMTEENLKCIGKTVGNVIEVDFDEGSKGRYRRFIRLRIEIDISRPLNPGFFLPRPGLNDLWISLKYERLPEFCFSCGVIGHDCRFCGTTQTKLKNQYGMKFIAFGQWLCSENNLFPPGIYEIPAFSEAQNSDEDSTAPLSTQEETIETNRTQGGTDDKIRVGQSGVEPFGGVANLAQLMAEALQAECNAMDFGIGRETRPTTLSGTHIVNTNANNLSGPHKTEQSNDNITHHSNIESPSHDTSIKSPISQSNSLPAHSKLHVLPIEQPKSDSTHIMQSPNPKNKTTNPPTHSASGRKASPSCFKKDKWKLRARSTHSPIPNNLDTPLLVNGKRKIENQHQYSPSEKEPQVSKIRRIDEVPMSVLAEAAAQPCRPQ